MRFPLIPLLLSALLASGCAARGTQAGPVASASASPVCDRSWQVEGAPTLRIDGGRPLSHAFGAGSRCLAEPSGVAVTYAVWRLPAHDKPWVLQVESHLDGRSLFAPELMLLDDNLQVLRRVRHERFVMRGAQLETSVFFDQENAAERYLLVRSATHVAGRGQVRTESGYFVVPIFAGLLPFLYMQGTEREREYVLAHSGEVRLLARSRPERAVPGQASRVELAGR